MDYPTPTHNPFSQSKLLSTSVVYAVQVLRKFFIKYLETFILILIHVMYDRLFKNGLHNAWKTLGEDKLRFDFKPCGLVKVCLFDLQLKFRSNFLSALWNKF